jgi:hypothetical protein
MAPPITGADQVFARFLEVCTRALRQPAGWPLDAAATRCFDPVPMWRNSRPGHARHCLARHEKHSAQ